MLNLIEREFDVQKFVNLPKCKKQYFDPTLGSGCLLTALWHGFGIIATNQYTYRDTLNGKEIGISDLMDGTDSLATKLGFRSEFKLKVGKIMRDRDLQDQTDFGGVIINFYDYIDANVALNIIWELINRLPNKVNVITEKEQVKNQIQVCQ